MTIVEASTTNFGERSRFTNRSPSSLASLPGTVGRSAARRSPCRVRGRNRVLRLAVRAPSGTSHLGIRHGNRCSAGGVVRATTVVHPADRPTAIHRRIQRCLHRARSDGHFDRRVRTSGQSHFHHDLRLGRYCPCRPLHRVGVRSESTRFPELAFLAEFVENPTAVRIRAPA